MNMTRSTNIRGSQLRLLYVQYTNPAGYPPLEHSSRILANAGWKVLFLGTGALGADLLEFPVHPNVEVRRWKFVRPGFGQKLHYVAFHIWCVWTALTWRPKWVYASDLFSCPVAIILKKLGFRVLYHEHDAPEEPEARRQRIEIRGQKLDVRCQLPVISRFQRLLLWLRRKLARSAEICVIPNEIRLQRFKQTTGRIGPTFCVWNCPMRAEAETEPQKSMDKFIIFYHGSIVPSRLPLTVIEALTQLPSNVILQIAGYETVGHSGYIAELETFATRMQISERFCYLGCLSRAQLLPETRRANVGLAFVPLESSDMNLSTMTGASNKPFEYLACRLALLVSNLPDWREMFVKPGYARACDPHDALSIAAALRWLVEHPAEAAEMAERGRERISTEWNYEARFAAVQEILNCS